MARGIATLSTLMALLFCGSGVTAQEPPQWSAEILVENLSAKASECGVSESQILGTVNSALRYNRIRTTTSSDSSVTVYINVNVLGLPSLCAASFDVSFRDYRFVPDNEVGMMFAKLVLCEHGGVATATRSLPHLYDGLRQTIDICISQLTPSVVAALTE